MNADLTACAACAELVFVGTCVCPHCGEKACATPRVAGPALLLGLTLAVGACGGQPKYGVPDTGGTPSGSESSSRAFQDVLLERGLVPVDAPDRDDDR